MLYFFDSKEARGCSFEAENDLYAIAIARTMFKNNSSSFIVLYTRDKNKGWRIVYPIKKVRTPS